MSTGRESTICISCNPESFSRLISICSSRASRASSTSPIRGRKGAALARALAAGKIELGAIHTYIELFARYFMDLTPHVALIAAVEADRDGNLYTGPNTEDTPTIVEATAFKSGIVVAQVNEVVDKVSRIDIPGDQVDFIIKSDKPFYVEPLFTRDPSSITENQILMAMMAIKGIWTCPALVERH